MKSCPITYSNDGCWTFHEKKRKKHWYFIITLIKVMLSLLSLSPSQTPWSSVIVQFVRACRRGCSLPEWQETRCGLYQRRFLPFFSFFGTKTFPCEISDIIHYRKRGRRVVVLPSRIATWSCIDITEQRTKGLLAKIPKLFFFFFVHQGMFFFFIFFSSRDVFFHHGTFFLCFFTVVGNCSHSRSVWL